jgi:hypothetical protein
VVTDPFYSFLQSSRREREYNCYLCSLSTLWRLVFASLRLCANLFYLRFIFNNPYVRSSIRLTGAYERR